MIIPYGRQHITDDDIKAVTEVLRSDYLTQGPEISAFETVFAAYVGAKHAAAVANGTAALHLCALALEVDESANVITTPITFAASANCVRYCGGNLYFADIDETTYTLDIEKVRQLIESKPKGFFKGIVPVDFAGYAVNLEAFRQLADEHGLWLIEDACHAPGGYFTDSKGQQQRCGNGNFAELAIFSFHPVKHIACGEGGMITTNSELLYKKLLLLRTHGITKDASLFKNSIETASGNQKSEIRNQDSFPGWYYEMLDLGYNYRLTDFQAALGISQLQRADCGLEKRRAIAQKYFDALGNHTGVLHQSGVVPGHAYHLYVVGVTDRWGLYEHLRANQIFAQVHYIPVHIMPYYQQFGYKPGDFPVAEKYYESCLSLPMFPSLTDEQHDFVIEKVLEFLD
jgi:UDP-4-amino-4,6-dideoxy-N-acetyl-beta-L-altrosamine transaminase